MANPEEIDEMPERRLVIIGARGEGKSSAANTILTKERFESSRTQTPSPSSSQQLFDDNILLLFFSPPVKNLEMKPIQKLQIILLGSRGVGKTSVMNTILGIKEQEDETTMVSQLHEGRVGRMEIAVVDTPGWRKGSSAHDTPKMIKDEVVQSLLKCHPGPDVFLLVIDADASFNRTHLKAATTHVELFGKNVWKHTMVVFTRGDWLGSRSIEEYIEVEGKSLQDLLEICGNRYHVLDNMNEYDGAQVDKLLEKILQTLALNGGKHFAPKQEMLNALRENEKKVQLAVQRRTELKATRGGKGPTKKLHEIKILILGEKKSGKTTAANLIVRDKVFSTQPNHGCMARQAPVADRQVTVVDTPGWAAEESLCTRGQDREIVNGLNLSPQGVDAVLIVLSLDLKFRKANLDALVDHITLFGDEIWNHTMVLFTNEDTLADKSLEEYIEKEDQALRQLVDRCGNNYHCLYILETRDDTQHIQLFKKIEDMSAKNQGRLFCPNMNDIYHSIDEKFQKRKLTFRNRVVQAFTSQSLALLRDHKTKLEKLQDNIKEIFASPLAQNKAKKKSVLSDIEEQIDELSRNIMKLNKSTNSMDIPRLTMSPSTPKN
ncbi:GTPase IMAP family member 8-like [Syngnathus scovelli]|uniref:GTPase IMAP family member 8-like n=1 Tax=Syngnathus scovelli TaxID=161590 RepID=UPI0035CA4373